VARGLAETRGRHEESQRGSSFLPNYSKVEDETETGELIGDRKWADRGGDELDDSYCPISNGEGG
jgi:hypothetical protein